MIPVLGSTIERIVKTKSPAYENYELPILEIKETGPPTHHIFKCKWYVCTCLPILIATLIVLGNSCGAGVRRKVGVMETAVLHSHNTSCRRRTYGEPLHEFGFTGGSRLTEQEVRELWALWVAQHARPYIIVDDNHVSDRSTLTHSGFQLIKSHQLPKLLHPDARTHKPSRKTLSADIKRLYEVTQKSITTLLAVSQMNLSYSNLVLSSDCLVHHGRSAHRS